MKYPSTRELAIIIFRNIFHPIRMAKRIYAIAQAFHEVPLSICKMDGGDGTYEVICVIKDDQHIVVGDREDVPWIFNFLEGTKRRCSYARQMDLKENPDSLFTGEL